MRISDWSSDVCSSDLNILAGDFLPLKRNKKREAGAEASKFSGSLKAPQVEIDQGGDGEVFDQVIELLIALRRSASRLIDTVVAVHCLAHISEVRSASGARLEADEIGMRDCLAVGPDKGRAVVRKKAADLAEYEGVASECLRGHFSFLSHISVN